jgi:hypothetical protein
MEPCFFIQLSQFVALECQLIAWREWEAWHLAEMPGRFMIKSNNWMRASND